MRVAVGILVSLLIAISLPAQAIGPVSGSAVATTGDSIQLGGEVYYLEGIVAPADYNEAQEFLASLLSGRVLNCVVREVSQGSKETAACNIDGNSLSAQMLSSGHVVGIDEGVKLSLDPGSQSTRSVNGIKSLSKYTEYIVGIESGSIPPRDCLIKGNKSHVAPYDRKYHVPTGRYYSRTRVNLSEGEMWFCDANEARAAGFLPAQ